MFGTAKSRNHIDRKRRTFLSIAGKRDLPIVRRPCWTGIPGIRCQSERFFATNQRRIDSGIQILGLDDKRYLLAVVRESRVGLEAWQAGQRYHSRKPAGFGSFSRKPPDSNPREQQ